MNPVRWKHLSLALLLMSAAFLGSTLVLPQLKSPQVQVYHGPAVSYYNGTSAISGYYIPTLEKGSRFNLTFSNFAPGKIQISVFPTQVGGIAPIPGVGPVYVQSLYTNETLTFKASDTQPYGVYVISYDKTTFVMKVTGNYSPYFWLAGYAAVGTITLFVTAIMFYYYTLTSRRWLREQKELKEATESTVRS